MDSDGKHQTVLAQRKRWMNVHTKLLPQLAGNAVSKLTFLLTCFGGQFLCPQTKVGSVFFQYFCILFEDQKKSEISVGPNLGIVSEGSNPK